MATFNIPRGDTTPVLEISLRIANSDPVEYWDATEFKPDGVSSREIHSVKFIMKNMDTGEIVIPHRSGPSPGVASYAYDSETGRTILRYAWVGADPDWPANPNAFPGDAGLAGVFTGEFEVTFEAPGGNGVPGRKRTFPSTPGDELIINVTEDLDGV